MDEDPELWRRLRIGDRVRLVRLPKEFFVWSALLPETKQAYKYLLNRCSLRLQFSKSTNTAIRGFSFAFATSEAE